MASTSNSGTTNVNTNAIRSTAALGAGMARLERRIGDLEEDNLVLRTELDENRREGNELRAELELLRNYVDSRLVELREKMERAAQHTVDGEEDLDEQERKALESEAWVRDNGWKDLVRTMFAKGMGISKLTPQYLPAFPEQGEDWPMRPDIPTQRLLRFKWDRDHHDQHNWEMITFISDSIVRHGAAHSPRVAPAILVVSDEDRLESVKKQFKSLARKMKDAEKSGRNENTPEQGANDGGEARVDEGDGMVDEGLMQAQPLVVPEKVERKLKATTRQSRARGKVEVRTRKRTMLPDKSIYKSSKYDAAFTPTAMSDDEDEFGNGDVPTGRFISRAPLYRSQILIQLYQAVDACGDPAPAKRYIPRVAGEIKDIPPPVTKSLSTRIRRWMVNNEWLTNEANSIYDTPSRIAESGRQWGDEKDPEEIEEAHRKAKEEKEEAKRKRPRIEGGEVVMARKKRVKGKAVQPAAQDEM
ncbi:hypothetical protein CCMSSC00406_0006911 [Pleurotus cornucopiae]|uniref:Uncharacterized protein n=1 Tax=Pleurotus cornucopiae TaxID=5321 RepID=A0ACB7IP64_PLECO|nr:hypothetical protein CCMSSC00406_0006911 [Pleurotus cornucopiae]